MQATVAQVEIVENQKDAIPQMSLSEFENVETLILQQPAAKSNILNYQGDAIVQQAAGKLPWHTIYLLNQRT